MSHIIFLGNAAFCDFKCTQDKHINYSVKLAQNKFKKKIELIFSTI